jgi:4-amino-4-deoxy-L-arabinose transferase-like glycosyltransferase
VKLRGTLSEGAAAACVTAVFVVLTFWWLSRDEGLQLYDAGSHLITALEYRDELAAGRLLEPITVPCFYPPAIFLVGAIATLIGGTSVTAAVVGQNLVYVPLLAFGCYLAGKVAYGRMAGLLAVVFALGSPLIVEQFHVFMIDAPVAAMVAVSVALILASDRFERVGVAALAGLAVGVGLASKEQFPLYLVGLLPVVLVRGGLRNPRGLAAFAGVALAIGVPWYLVHLENLGLYAGAALPNAASIPERSTPPLLSLANLEWYGWAILNTLLFVPLALFAAAGTVSELVALVRRRVSGAVGRVQGVAPELLGGLGGGWLALTVTPHHDIRYTQGLLVYLGVLGTGWVVRLSSGWRAAAVATLALAVTASVLAAGFGLGGQLRIVFGSHPDRTEAMLGVAASNQLVLHSDRSFLKSAPDRDGEPIARLFDALRETTDEVAWLPDHESPAFDGQGLFASAKLAGLHVAESEARVTPRTAFMFRARRGSVPPCVVLSDGSGVWVFLGMPGPGRPTFCPFESTLVAAP